MIFAYVEPNAIEQMIFETSPSPEDFLIMLEEALEEGALTIEEVSALIQDFNKRS